MAKPKSAAKKYGSNKASRKRYIRKLTTSKQVGPAAPVAAPAAPAAAPAAPMAAPAAPVAAPPARNAMGTPLQNATAAAAAAAAVKLSATGRKFAFSQPLSPRKAMPKLGSDVNLFINVGQLEKLISSIP